MQRPQASIIVILTTLGLDALGTGIIAPVVPGLVRDLGHLSPVSAAPWIGAMLAAYASMQFLLSPLLGALSDRYGRRPVILASVAGLGCDYLALALAPSLPWLFVGRLVAGATSANVAAATAYMADITPEEGRAKRFGLIGATFGAGFVVGPALGGFLGGYGLRLPFIAAGVLSLLNVAFGLFVLPESLTEEHRRPFEWSRANPFRLISRVLHDRTLWRLTASWSCSWVGLAAVQSSLVLFTNYKFHWTEQTNGLILAVVGLSQALVEGVLLRWVVGRLGERVAAIIGYACGTAGFVTLSLANTGFMVVPAVILIALGGLAMPAVRAMVSGTGDAETQGEMQGVLSAAEGLTAVVAPLAASALFWAFTAHIFPITFPGAPFVLAAITALVAATLIRRLQPERVDQPA